MHSYHLQMACGHDHSFMRVNGMQNHVHMTIGYVKKGGGNFGFLFGVTFLS